MKVTKRTPKLREKIGLIKETKQFSKEDRRNIIEKDYTAPYIGLGVQLGLLTFAYIASTQTNSRFLDFSLQLGGTVLGFTYFFKKVGSHFLYDDILKSTVETIRDNIDYKAGNIGPFSESVEPHTLDYLVRNLP